jgi:hypothetical protein
MEQMLASMATTSSTLENDTCVRYVALPGSQNSMDTLAENRRRDETPSRVGYQYGVSGQGVTRFRHACQPS